jgi:hypothetical protein
MPLPTEFIRAINQASRVWFVTVDRVAHADGCGIKSPNRYQALPKGSALAGSLYGRIRQRFSGVVD